MPRPKYRRIPAALLASIIAALSLSGISAAQLECLAHSGASCPPGYPAEVFQMSANDDAHASHDGSYGVRVCCDYPGLALTGGHGACSGALWVDYDVALRLSGPNDAHAEKNTETTPAYEGNDVCIGAPGASQVVCEYAMDCATLGAGYECVARLSGDTDAHVSDCSVVNGYESVCCMIVSGGGPLPGTGRLILGSDHYYLSLGENRLVPFTVRNIESSPDNMTIRLGGFETSGFDYMCGSGCSISSDKRKLIVRNMNPGEGRTYFMRLMASAPGTDQFELNVTIDSNPDFYEVYTAKVTTGYPVFFPGIGVWGMAFILAAACAVFLIYGESRKAKDI